MTQRSSLENYTDNNTRQQDTTRAQHEAIRDNISTTRHNTSTKKARVAKTGFYIAPFVTGLYNSLIYFRNS